MITTKADVLRFVDDIGFLGDKAARAEEVRASLYHIRMIEPPPDRLGPILFDRVYMIERTESAPVYDLAIAETHNFVANDFIVRTSSWSSRVAAGCIELGEQTTHANRVDRPTSESVWRPGDGGTDELDKSWG
ncbi:MAG: hypothetical protein E6J90_14375 [Deltaproteobacteria bacterium]|nr:MAG: hypothetical protein E6J90_14375 [Deltaproteobacteria bacterium]